MPGSKRSRRRRLESAVAYVQQRYGQDALRRGQAQVSIPHVSTGFPALDAILGIGGIPCGRLSLFSGMPTSGKRTLAALTLAEAQRGNKAQVGYVDVSQTCDADYLARCGIDLRRLLVGRPADSREALDMLVTLSEERELSAVVFDGWTALAPDDATRRSAAAVLDSLAPRLARSSVALIVLDEPPSLWRGLVSALMGDPADQALGQLAALHLSFSRERWLSLGPDVRGYGVQVEVRKNKFGPAGQKVVLEIRFNGKVQGNGL